MNYPTRVEIKHNNKMAGSYWNESGLLINSASSKTWETLKT
ncbi:MAG TPA: hypothetical protein PLP03_04170 [Bacteroidales bacterium]|nr:hypothetical protein [Bacteroidales bacterium]